MQHIKEQNWFAVGLDVIVVIVGIFLGIKVTNWNEQLSLKQDEQETLQLLQKESEILVNAWIDSVSFHKQQNDQRRLLLQALHTGNYDSDSNKIYEGALLAIGHYPAVSVPETVLSDLTESGKIANLSNIEVRYALSKYREELEFIKGQLPQFRRHDYYDTHKGLVKYIYDPSQTSLRRIEYDLSAIAEDDAFIQQYLLGTRNQITFQRYRINVLIAAINFCNEVSNIVGKNCEVAIPFDIQEQIDDRK